MGCTNCAQRAVAAGGATRRGSRRLALRHIGRAAALLEEARQSEYAAHRWRAVGYLGEAEAEIAQISATVANRLREVRHAIESASAYMADMLALLDAVLGASADRQALAPLDLVPAAPEALPSGRPACLACALKHVTQAGAALGVARQTGREAYRWLAGGHLLEGEDEICGVSLTLATRVRAARLTIEDGGEWDCGELVDALWAQADGQVAPAAAPKAAVASSATAKVSSATPAPATVNALLLAPDRVLNSPLGASLTAVCAASGITLKTHSTTNGGGLRAIVEAQRHVIGWGLGMPPDWYGSNGRKVLYIENGLLKQGAGIWVDANGCWDRSRLCTSREYDQVPTAAELVALSAHVATHLGGTLFGWQAPAQPRVVVALQRSADAPMRWHFPAAGKTNRDTWRTLLQILAANLPSGPAYLIRPHPRHIDEWNAREAELMATAWRDDWTVDRSPDVYALMRSSSALVTVNSTTAIEATALGLPTATLGRGCWTGSNATLECDAEAGLLAGLLTWRPDRDRCQRLLCAVLRHQLSYQAAPSDVANHPDVTLWLQSITAKEPLMP